MGNRGTEPADGFQVRSEPHEARVATGPLEPGEISRPVLLGLTLAGPTATLQTSSSECNLANNEVPLERYECLLP